MGSLSDGDYVSSRQELNSLITSNLEEANYVSAQHIYLDFLESGLHSISPYQLNFLRNVGSGEGKLDAYSRTILYLVSGERIWSEVPYAEQVIERRESRKIART